MTFEKSSISLVLLIYVRLVYKRCSNSWQKKLNGFLKPCCVFVILLDGSWESRERHRFDLDPKNLPVFVRGKVKCFSWKRHLYQTAELFKRKVIRACRISRAINFLLKILLGRVRWQKKILRENNIIMQLPFWIASEKIMYVVARSKRFH